MRVEEATQTVGGHPWRFLMDCGGDYIIGVYLRGDQFIPSRWRKDGKSIAVDFLDLDLTDWRDEIPWSNLDSRIVAIARDRDGTWTGFGLIPDKPMFGQWGSAPSDKFDGPFDCLSLEGLYIPNAPSDWTQTLAIRPGCEKKEE